MRATLEQLKAMSDVELIDYWHDAKFPFEMASCGKCLTMHHRGYSGSCRTHDQLSARVNSITWGPIIQMLREGLEELYALRILYDSLYPQSIEAAPSPTEAVAMVVAK